MNLDGCRFEKVNKMQAVEADVLYRLEDLRTERQGGLITKLPDGRKFILMIESEPGVPPNR